MHDWYEIPPVGHGESPIPLPENGWGSLVAWTAGPRYARTQPRDESRQVLVDADGARRTEPVSAEERASDHAAVVDYLSKSGIPAPPADIAFLILLPGSATLADLECVVNEAIATAPELDFVAERRAVEDVLPAFLRSESRGVV